ncbi:MAG: hypothetical protein Q8S94_13200, partial [Pseudohongiella sp.]|nr:hypothetical protein [Pseudohongiella sp.]
LDHCGKLFFKLLSTNFVTKTAQQQLKSANRSSPFHELLMSGARIMPRYFYLARSKLNYFCDSAQPLLQAY